jgi:hypothetical protein
MKFSERTNAILKNFAAINPSIMLNAGNIVKTISPMKTMVAVAKIQEDIPSDAGIFDLSRFLSVCGLYAEPEINFKEKMFEISEGKKKTTYKYTDASMMVTPSANVKLPAIDITIELPWATLQSVLKAAGVLQLPEIAFVGENGVCRLSAIKSDDKTADTYDVELCETDDEFFMIIKTENLRLLPDDYTVSLSSKGISSFSSKDVEYFIPVNSKSEYKKG